MLSERAHYSRRRALLELPTPALAWAAQLARLASIKRPASCWAAMLSTSRLVTPGCSPGCSALPAGWHSWCWVSAILNAQPCIQNHKLHCAEFCEHLSQLLQIKPGSTGPATSGLPVRCQGCA